MVDHARVECQNHRFTYNEPMRVGALTQAVCDLALSFGEDGENKDSKMSRPFGTALLVAGHDDLGPQLFMADPSGSFIRYKAKAIGSGSEGAQQTLQESYSDAFTLDEASTLALTTLKAVMEDKITSDNVELATVTEAGGYVLKDAAGLKALLDALP